MATGRIPSVQNASTLAGTTLATNVTASSLTSLGTSPALTTPTISTTTTNGDLLYGTGSGAIARLGIGSSAQVLTVASGIPSWATPAGGGKVLQLVSATFASETDTSSTTYQNTGLTATITPTLATSRIYVQITAPFLKNAGNANNGVKYRITRGASAVATWEEASLSTGSTINNSATFGLLFVDSPATTSATTYALQFANVTAASLARICSGGALATIQLLEIGA